MVTLRPNGCSNRRGGVNGSTSTTLMISLLLVLMAMVSRTSAYTINLNSDVHESNFLKEMEIRGEIHIDQRQPPPRPSSVFQRRQVGEDVESTTTAEAAATESADSAPSTTETANSANPTTTARSSTEEDTSATPTTVSGTTLPSVTVVTTSLPSAFDTSLGSNFTKPSCPRFFSSFLSNTTFQSCLPVSLFLQNSHSFIQVEKSATLLAQTLAAACEAPLAVCMPLLNNLATELIDPDNCGTDFNRQNPLVLQAYSGFMAYEPVYRATCLKSSQTGNYCFSDAVLNKTNPFDFYPYLTAVGMTLPAVVEPTCNQCLHDTMDIFAGYAGTDNQPLAKTYLSCATQIDSFCGASFASTDVKAGATKTPGSSGASLPQISTMSVGVVAILVAVWLGI